MFDANFIDAQHQADTILLRLLPLLRPRTVRVDATLDLRQPLVVHVNHLDDDDHTADYDAKDRHEQTT